MEAGSFWNDQEKAKATIAELKTLNAVLKPFEALVRVADDLATLNEMADEVGDHSLDGEIRQAVKAAEDDFNGFELRSMLSGPNDQRNALVTIHAGAGGT